MGRVAVWVLAVFGALTVFGFVLEHAGLVLMFCAGAGVCGWYLRRFGG
jgi:hypothetical protein